MYTYTRPFVGIPFSQLHSLDFIDILTSEDASFFEELCNISTDDWRLENLDAELFSEYELSKFTHMFLTWCMTYKEWLLKNNFDFRTSYHGSDETPVIFGTYVDQLFSVPDIGLGLFDFSGIDKIRALHQQLYDFMNATMPLELFAFVKPWMQVWFNNHSS